MNILGISAFYHDSAACLIKNGKIIAAVQEERFTRLKHDSSFPIQSIKYCIKEGKLNPRDLDYIVFYEKPFLKFERLLETYFAFAPKGLVNFLFSSSVWIKDKLFQKRIILQKLNETLSEKCDWNTKLLFSDHHLSHAASAFFPSPFREAAILTIDGVGEWTTTSISIGKNNTINNLKEIHFPHSLGLLYSAFTYYIGFKVNSGEYKLMGLAPYGTPKYNNLIKNNLIKISRDGSFKLNMDFFNFCTGLTMTSRKFNSLFNQTPRKPEEPITQNHMDIAASIQNVIEEIILKICQNISKTTKQKNLCLSGGVALNCVANGKIIKSKIFDNIWIQPAAGDAGAAVGAALAVHYLKFKNIRKVLTNQDQMKGSFLGPKFSNVEIKKDLKQVGANFDYLSEKELITQTVENLCEGKAIGWFQGKMEFGPRALGARSIIADPRSAEMQKILNLKIKFRESFRPFAPSILVEDLKDWFYLDIESPYMLLVGQIKSNKKYLPKKKKQNLFGFEKLNFKRSEIPAVTHVDYSSRIQTVDKKTNPRFHSLISKFKEKTGCPVLVNTSFNVRGEPIILSPQDAFRCFMGTGLDILVIENFFLKKKEQNKQLINNYKMNFEAD